MWLLCFGFFFFFKQKTAYEMRISDWSSDVCSSDLAAAIQHWTDSGKIAAIDPYHLIFMIWASTQHYTDFLPQITAVMGIKRFTKAHYGAAERSICDIILRGVLTSRGINS